MVMFSSQVSQQIYMQQIAMQQQMQQAQMLSMQMGLMPPAMPQMNLPAAMSNVGTAGIYGEQISNRVMGAARMAGTVGTLGLGAMGLISGLPLDPFSAAIAGGRAGFASAGIGGAAIGAAGMALPFMAVGAGISAYTGAFSGGMREQAATNSMLRSNFNFMGGQGTFGRGFSQMQMGQIGNMLANETQRSPFTSSQELNQLIQGGQEAGMFRAVRDVESFSRRFRTMLDGLRKIQQELGGTLTDALQFTRGAQQLGIFSTGGQRAFATEMRNTMSVTGMDQNQVFNLAATGSMLSRATGGVGRQGAVGAIRTARQLGSALSMGVINEEALSEATGGLQGNDAIQALSARALQMSDRFSRTGAGRYSLFSLANEQGTGLDAAALARFRSGDISVGSIMRDAHGRVNRMGRARALNNEGRLRGALMEEGGLSAQLGILRLRVGERALEGSDDLAQLVMQRRMGVSAGEAQIFTSLLRNQGGIAANEDVQSTLGRRQVERQRDIQMNRSVDAFMANFQHGLAEVSGTNRARELGRNFLTRVSSTIERTLNDVVGATGDALTVQDRSAIARIATGRGTREDVERMTFSQKALSGAGVRDPYAQSSIGAALHAIGMHGPRTLGETMDARMSGFAGMSSAAQDRAVMAMQMAQRGIVRGADLTGLRELQREGVGSDSMHRLAVAHAAGGRNQVYASFGNQYSANTLDAFAARSGFNMGANDYMMPGVRRGGVANNLDVLAGAVGTYAASWGAAGAAGGALLGGGLGAGLGGALGAIGGGIMGTLAGLERITMTDQDHAASFLARGGHAGAAAREIVGLSGSRGRGMGHNARDSRMTRQDAASVLSLTQARSMFDVGGDKPVADADIKKVMANDRVTTGLRRARSRDGKALEQELTALEAYASTLPREEQRALVLITQQARFNQKNLGGMGDEINTWLESREKVDQAKQEFRDYGMDYGAAADQIADTELRASISRASSALYAYDPEAAARETTGAARRIATMSDEDLRVAQSQLGTNATGQSLLMQGMRRKNVVKQVMGRGRRGVAAGHEAMLGELTGYSLGEMDLELGGKKINRNRAAQIVAQEMRRGGANADDLMGQISSFMGGKGVNVSGYLQELQAGYQSNGGLESGEIHNLLDKLDQDKGVQNVKEQGVAAAMRAKDPVAYDSLMTLKDIKNLLTPGANQSTDAKLEVPEKK